MARLGSLLKLGFYPTPESVVKLIAKHIQMYSGGEFTFYDPCCGDGSALVQLRDALSYIVHERQKEVRVPDIRILGVELDQIRAEAAATKLDQAVNADAFLAHTSDEKGNPLGVELLYLNPPYAGVNADGRGQERWETRFLEYSLPGLRQNGILAFVVREPYLQEYSTEVMRILGDNQMGSVNVYRFPEPEYNAFQQVVLFAKRSVRFHTYNFDPCAVLGMGVPALYSKGLANVYTYSLPYTTPAYGKEKRAVAEIRVAAVEVEPALIESDPDTLYEYLGDPRQHTDFQPLMEMKDTLAVLVASGGMLNGVEVSGQLLRGDSYKIVTTHTEKIPGDHGHDVLEEWTVEEMVHRLTLLNLTTGVINQYSSHSEFDKYQTILTDHLPDILSAAYEMYPPMYKDEDYTRYEKVLDTIPSPKKLANRKDGKAGLLEAQSQRVAAIVHGWKNGLQVLTMIGEMSTGKTICSLSAGMAYGTKRIVIFCPAEKDVRTKWMAEIKGILGPLGWKAVLATTVTSVQDAFSSEKPTVIVLPETTAKLSSGWESVEPQEVWRYAWVPYGADGQPDVRQVALKLQVASRHFQPVLYPIARKIKGVPHEAQRYKSHYVCNQCGRDVRLDEFVRGRVRNSCRYCEEPFWQARSSKRIAKNSFSDFDNQVRNYRKHLQEFPVEQREELWKLFALKGDKKTGNGKVALAQFIADHYPRQYILIIDEAHETKSGSAARSIAAQDLMAVADRTLQMTGTIFGGKASSLFYLLYRSSPTFRKLYAFDEVQRFVNMYGLSQSVKKFYPQFTETRTFNGYREFQGSPSEKEGIHPGMATLLLPYSIYLTLADLQFAMPEREQYTLYTPFPESFKTATEKWLGDVKTQAVKEMRDGSMSALSQWQQARFRVLDCPNIPDEIAGKKYTPDSQWDDKMLPKEEALLRLIYQEKMLGRRCLMFVQQPNRGDPTPRLFKFMEKYGFKGRMMKAVVKDRLDFIRDALNDGCDVVATSVPLVRQSIDIVETPTIIHYGVTHNIYMIPQANARPYRLTQEHTVKIYYMAHQSSVQAAVWDVVANKLAASAMLQGDPVQGLANLKGESSFARTMVDMVVEDVEYSSDLTIDSLPLLPTLISAIPKSVVGFSLSDVSRGIELDRLESEQFRKEAEAANVLWSTDYAKIYLPRSTLVWAKKLPEERRDNVLKWGLCPNCRMEFDGIEPFQVRDGYRYHFNC